MSKDKNPDAMTQFFDRLLSLDDSPRWQGRRMPCGRRQSKSAARRDPNRCGGRYCKVCYPPVPGDARWQFLDEGGEP